jgi:hypothetical protein
MSRPVAPPAPTGDVLTPAGLPGVLKTVAEITSVDVAVALARWKGGRVLYIPMEANLGPDHEMIKKLGRRAALRIARHFGRGDVLIPQAKNILTWMDARRMRREGKSTAEIAKALNRHQRHIMLLVRGVEADPGAIAAVDRCVICGKRHGAGKPRPDDRQLALALPVPKSRRI